MITAIVVSIAVTASSWPAVAEAADPPAATGAPAAAEAPAEPAPDHSDDASAPTPTSEPPTTAAPVAPVASAPDPAEGLAATPQPGARAPVGAESGGTGLLTIALDSVPDAAQDFTFELCALDAGGGCGLAPETLPLDDDTDPALAASVTVERSPGAYRITQTAVAGWSLTAVRCGSETIDLGRRRAIVDLADGESLTCTFEVRQASLTLVQDTQPNDGQDLTFDVCPAVGPCQQVVLDDDADGALPSTTTLDGLVPGNYTVTQVEQALYPLVAVDCTTGTTSVEDRRATLVVDAGQQPRCSFRNRPTMLSVSHGSGYRNGQDFEFSVCRVDDCQTFALDDDNDPTLPTHRTMVPLVAGTYIVRQAPSPGMPLERISCSVSYGDVAQDVDLAGGQVTLDLEPGAQVTCYFRNDNPAVIVTLDAVPDDAQDATFRLCPEAGDCRNLVLDDDTDPTRATIGAFDRLESGQWTLEGDVGAGWAVTSLTCQGGVPDPLDGSIRMFVSSSTDNYCNASMSPTSFNVAVDARPDGPQDFEYDVCEVGGTCTTLALDDDGDATLPASAPVPDAAAGARYTITQRANEEWGLSSVSCAGADVDLSLRRAEVTLVAGQALTCRFTNRQTSVTIVQDTTPDGDRDFTFTGCAGPGGANGCGTFTFDDDADATLPRSQTFTGLRADVVYTLTQAATAGYGLTAVSCGSGEVSLRDRRVVLVLQAGEQVTCTFSNRPTGITILQDTAPNSAQDVSYSGCQVGFGCSAFVLDDDSDPALPRSLAVGAIEPGTYTITQAVPDGHGLTSIACTGGGEVDLAARRVTLAIKPGDQVACTFVDRATSLTFVQDTSPNSAQDFAYTGCAGPGGANGCGSFSLDDDSDPTLPTSVVYTALPSAAYQVTQDEVAGYGLTALTCNGAQVDLRGRTMSVVLEPGDTVTCTFVDKVTSITVVQDTQPNSDVDVTFMGCAGTGGALGCGPFVLDDDADATLPSSRTFAVVPGRGYQLTQATLPGYGLVSVVCGSAEVDLTARRASFTLQPGDQLTCTFADRPTTVTVTQDTSPDGAQDFSFRGCRAGAGPGACNSFALDDDADATLPRTVTFTAVESGTAVTISQEVPAGYGLTSLSCSRGDTDLRTASVALVLQPGDQVTCTFVDALTSVRVVQDSDPDGPQDFTYHHCPVASGGGACTTFALDNDADATLPASTVVGGLDASVRYRLTQDEVAGFGLTSLICTTGEVDLEDRSVTLVLRAGEQATCTFYDSATTLAIVQNTEPDAPQDFAFTACRASASGTTCTDFSLDDDADAVLPNTMRLGVLEAETTVTVTQAVTSGWGLWNLTCASGEVDLAQRSVTVVLSPGEQVTCTFRDSVTGLRVAHDMRPNSGRDVSFTACGPGLPECATAVLDDDTDGTLSNQVAYKPIADGEYTVTALPAPGLVVVSITCGGGEVDLAAGRATFRIDPGEDAICTFVTNETTLTIVQHTVNHDLVASDAGQSFPYTACLEGGACESFELNNYSGGSPPGSRVLRPTGSVTYTIDQGPVAGFGVEWWECTDGRGGSSPAPVTVHLDPGEQVTCTWTSTASRLYVFTNAVAADGQDTPYSVCGPVGCSSFTLDADTDATLPDTHLDRRLPAGTYTVTQGSLPAGWVVSSIDCRGEGTVDLAAGRVTLAVVDGQQVFCTFINRQTSLTVVVDTVANAARDIGFQFCPVGGGACTSFTLDDDADATLSNRQVFSVLAPGAYTVTQDALDDWDVTTLACDTGEAIDLAARRATVTLSSLESSTCTFTNQTPSITVVHDVGANGASTDFTYTLCRVGTSNCSTVQLDDDSNPPLSNTGSFGDLVPGAYTVTQTAVNGRTLQSITCGTGDVVEVGARRATVTLGIAEPASCTFVTS